MANRYSTDLIFRSSAAEAKERVLAILDLFDWKNDGFDGGRISARTKFSSFGLGEYITISFVKKRILVESESINPFQFFDLGKNQNNVEKFIEAFHKRQLPLEEQERSFLDRFFSGR